MSDPKIGVNTGNRGKGRPKGAANKTTSLLKDAVLLAAEIAGGNNSDGIDDGNGLTRYLIRQANAQPVAFMAMLGKVLPIQLAHSGEILISHEAALNELDDGEGKEDPAQTP